jgi:hypothetical protein
MRFIAISSPREHARRALVEGDEAGGSGLYGRWTAGTAREDGADDKTKKGRRAIGGEPPGGYGTFDVRLSHRPIGDFGRVVHADGKNKPATARLRSSPVVFRCPPSSAL